MDGYILDLRNKYQHITPKKTQCSPHKYHPIDYGATQQLVQSPHTTPILNEKGMKRIQGIVGASLYLGKAVNNKLIVALSAIGAQQAEATENTEQQLNNFWNMWLLTPMMASFLEKSDMILAANADAGFLNESKARSRAGAHTLFSENEPKPKLNGPVLTFVQIIKTVMSSVAEA